MTPKETIRITSEDKKLLWQYKLDNNCKSLSQAIGHAITLLKLKQEEK
jgi:hypothetical protein